MCTRVCLTSQEERWFTLGLHLRPRKAVRWWFVLWDSCFWQACAHGSPRSTSSQSSWPMVTCWTTCGSATERRSMLWCCYTWPHRSPLPWNTWRKKTLYTGGFEGLKSKIANLSWVYKTGVFFIVFFFCFFYPSSVLSWKGQKHLWPHISFSLIFLFFSPLLPEQCSSHVVAKLVCSGTSSRIFWKRWYYLWLTYLWNWI